MMGISMEELFSKEKGGILAPSVRNTKLLFLYVSKGSHWHVHTSSPISSHFGKILPKSNGKLLRVWHAALSLAEPARR